MKDTPCFEISGFPNALPLPRVRRRVLERGAGDADRRRGDLRPRALEEVHRDQEALAGLAEQAVGRDPRAVEQDRAGVRRAQAELALLAAGGDARVAALEQERGERAVELREQDGHVRDPAVRDVALLAVEDVLVALAAGGRGDRGDVGARARLVKAIAERQPSGEAIRGRYRERCSSLPKATSGRTGNIVAWSVAARPAQPHESSSAISADVSGEVPPPPYSAGTAYAVSPTAAARAQQVGREVVARVPLRRDRPQLALRELVRERLELALLGGEPERDALVAHGPAAVDGKSRSRHGPSLTCHSSAA